MSQSQHQDHFPRISTSYLGGFGSHLFGLPGLFILFSVGLCCLTFLHYYNFFKTSRLKQSDLQSSHTALSSVCIFFEFFFLDGSHCSFFYPCVIF